MKKIVFILSAIEAVHAIKRIDEFIDNGYEVEVYGFSRESTKNGCLEINSNIRFKINIIGVFSNEVPYYRRLPIIIKGIRKVISEIKNEDILYIFGLDLAMYLSFHPRITYIYEEADLTYTYLKNKILRRIFKKIDRSIILRSLETVLTSDGFYEYHFENEKKKPSNVSIIPNKLNPSVKQLEYNNNKILNINKIRFGFIGGIRFQSIYNFVKVIAEHFPQHEVLLYGVISHTLNDKMISLIDTYPNISYFGRFQNPSDLPDIYNKIDISIGTYDITSDNVKYAEPNKFYESIYFSVPIIVSSETFLSKKVLELGIGAGIDASNQSLIKNFIGNLDINQIDFWKNNINQINKNDCINYNPIFFEKLKSKLRKK